MKTVITCLVLFALSICLINASHAANVDNNNENQQLAIIIQTHEAFYLQSSPFNQPEVGGTNAKLPNLSADTLLTHYQQRLAIYQQLLALDDEKLTQDNQINLSVLSYSLKNQLDNYTNKEHFMPLTAESGFHVWIASISTKGDFKTFVDYQDYLARLAALPNYFLQQTNWMKEGLKQGISQPKIVLKGFEQSILAFIKEDVT